MADLYVINAFVEINAVHDQIMDNTQPLGEMSDRVKTFSPSKTRYSNPTTYPNNQLTVFKCTKDDVAVAVPTGALDHILDVHDRLINQFHPATDFQDQLEEYLPAVNETGEWGSMRSYGNWLLPGWIKWEEWVNGNRIQFNLWLSAETMETTYTDYTIRVIPPVTDLAALNGTLTEFKNALGQFTTTSLIAAINDRTNSGAQPATQISSLNLKWVDPATKAVQYATWTLVVYGPEGLVRANQLEAIRQYLTQALGDIPTQLTEVIPELDNETIMTIYPLWHKAAITSSGSVPYMHSPVVSIVELEDALATRWDDPTTFIRQRTRYTVCPYKGIGLVAHPEEISQTPKTFDVLYPAYTLTKVNTFETSMIPEPSKSGLTGIEAGVRIAETITATDLSALEDDYLLESEDDLTFLTFIVNTVKHRICTRESWLNKRNS